jgi:ribosomal protein L17
MNNFKSNDITKVPVADQLLLLKEVLAALLLETGISKRDLTVIKREVEQFLYHVPLHDLPQINHDALDHYFNHLVSKYQLDRTGYRHIIRHLFIYFDYAQRFGFPSVNGFVAGFIEKDE